MYLDRDLDWFFRPMRGNDKVARYPLTNLGFDENEVLHIEVAVAGFSKDEIKMELNGNILHIHGEKQEKEESKLKYLQCHISGDNFNRSVVLNDNYVGGEINASCENGILKVTVQPKPDVRKLITIQ